MGFLIGQGVGRWGNFTNQEAFGSNTDSILGMTGGQIQQTIIDQSSSNVSELYAVHPCFLYESLWCILGFILLSLYSKHRKYDGQLLLMYMTWYGAERFIVEGLRTDSLMVGSIRISQLVSAILVIVSVIVQLVMISKVKRDPERYVLYCNTEESKLLLAESEKRRSGTDDNNDMPESENVSDDSIIVKEENENGTDN
jgi:phosphatidylglycerol:prolipoprotein diacylglycerol transferase